MESGGTIQLGPLTFSAHAPASTAHSNIKQFLLLKWRLLVASCYLFNAQKDPETTANQFRVVVGGVGTGVPSSGGPLAASARAFARAASMACCDAAIPLSHTSPRCSDSCLRR